MIIQGLIDFVCLWIAGILSIIPPLPSWFSNGLSQITAGMTWVGQHVGGLGAVVPFDVLYNLGLAWLGAWTFFVAMLGLRLILWIFGR